MHKSAATGVSFSRQFAFTRRAVLETGDSRTAPASPPTPCRTGTVFFLQFFLFDASHFICRPVAMFGG